MRTRPRVGRPPAPEPERRALQDRRRTRRHQTVRTLVPLALALLPLACSGSDAERAASEAAEAATAPLGFPAPPSAPYEVVAVPNGGLVTGTVRLDGAAPRDTSARVTTDRVVCGRGPMQRTLAIDDGRVGGAIVWLHDIRTGKRLPIERLFEVLHDDCQIEPRVQAVVTGGMLNVRSADTVAHRTRFTHLHGGEMLAVVRQTDAGSVVPVESVVARPGLVQIRCDVHPATRGWIAVFDHPYFVESDRGGRFVLTEVPAGRYRLVAWHEQLGRAERMIEVLPGRETNVELVFSDAESRDLFPVVDSATRTVDGSPRP